MMNSETKSKVVPIGGRHDDHATNGLGRRGAPRRRVLKSAIAAYSDRHCTIPCVVRDISTTGARLVADGSINIPDNFELLIDLDGLEAQCEVVWRKGKEIGVRFLGAARRTTPKRRQIISVPSASKSFVVRRHLQRRVADEAKARPAPAPLRLGSSG